MTTDDRPPTAHDRQGPIGRGRPEASGRWPVVALLLLFIALSGVYNAMVPLGEGPDEPGHLAYVFFLARERRLPEQRSGPAASDVPGEGHQPPLAYLLAAPLVAWLPADDRQIVLRSNEKFLWAGGDEPAAFMRGSRELWPWRGSTLAWHIARASSTLWGAATILFTYLAARALWPGRRSGPLLAAALVALNPQFLFTSALVSNDPLLAALGAATLWRCLALARQGGRAAPWADLVGCGLLFGLALLTKQSALLLGPLLLWAGWRAAGGEPRRALAHTLAWGVTAVLVAGWWYLRNWRLYGDLFGAAMFSAEFAGQPFVWGSPAAWLAGLGQLFGSFWARFGWMSVAPPAWAIWSYAALVGLALFGWLRGGRAGGRGPAGLWAGPALLLGSAALWVLSFVGAAGLVGWQGRMLFPAIGAIGALLAGGVLNAKCNMQNVAIFAFCILHFALTLYMPFGVIAPAYTWHTLAPARAQAELGAPVYARYAQAWERGVALRGWRLEAPARPGADLPVALTWNSIEPIPRSWTVFVHLVNADGRIVAESNSRPQGGAFPFTYWTPDDWVADRHRLALPADLPPGEYRLIVGLYRPEKGNIRQPVWAEDGAKIGDLAEVGAIQVAP